jgi:hypothetical protein
LVQGLAWLFLPFSSSNSRPLAWVGFQNFSHFSLAATTTGLLSNGTKKFPTFGLWFNKIRSPNKLVLGFYFFFFLGFGFGFEEEKGWEKILQEFG